MSRAPAYVATALALVAGSASAADDSALARLTARAEACIRANAPDVERLETSLLSATDFLAGNLCAVEVGARENYARNSAMLASMRSMQNSGWDDDEDASASPVAAKARQKAADKMKALYAKMQIDPETGEVKAPAGSSLLMGFTITSGNRLVEVPADLRALAARATLDARRARLTR